VRCVAGRLQNRLGLSRGFLGRGDFLEPAFEYQERSANTGGAEADGGIFAEFGERPSEPFRVTAGSVESPRIAARVTDYGDFQVLSRLDHP
jgi:hypothetical protein